MPLLNVGTENGTPVELHYEDYGSGKPVVLIHGWPLCGRSLGSAGPGAGRRPATGSSPTTAAASAPSSQPWDGYDYDTFAADLDALLRPLDLRERHAGRLLDGRRRGRALPRHATARTASRRRCSAAAVPPYLYQSDDNPDGGLDDATIEQFEGGVTGTGSRSSRSSPRNFFSAGGELKVCEDQRLYAKQIAAFASPKGTLDCIAAFGRTDFRGDLEKVDGARRWSSTATPTRSCRSRSAASAATQR